jgi:hypothetical protein
MRYDFKSGTNILSKYPAQVTVDFILFMMLGIQEVHLLNICYLSYTYIGEALSPETPLLNAIVV